MADDDAVPGDDGTSSSTSSTTGDTKSSSSVQVAVRVRPLNEAERSQACESCIDVTGKTVLLTGKRYRFNAVFNHDSQQETVYEQLVAPLIDRFFDGYNATVFAYGQTGSGKTFTMGNEFKLSVQPAERGIIPRVMDNVFGRIKLQDEIKKCVIKISFLEILNEEIRDLLSPSTPGTGCNTGLSVRDDGKRGIIVAGLSEHTVHSIDEVGELLRAGAHNRATASTSMNAHSSRSHAICTLTMEQYDTNGMESKFSKFHLVDLAGSERAKRTNAEGARFKEGVNINRGLLSLGNVINALSERSRTNTTSTSSIHIPYRDSKLTRLLQDSLGGNSKTLMIACISPADINYEETGNTLRYASRARNIENEAVVNKAMSAENEVNYLKQQLEIVQLQLLQAKQISHRDGSSGRTLSGTGENWASGNTTNLKHEVQKWRDLAQKREEELLIVMSSKNKWKKLADELISKKNPTASSANSPSRALLHDATEYEKSIHIDMPSEPEDTSSSCPLTHEQMTADIANLSDVILEKMKIMKELAACPSLSSSVTETRLASLTASYEQKILQLESELSVLTAENKQHKTNDKRSSMETPKDDGSLRIQLQKLQNQLQVARQAGKECKRLTNLWKSGTLKISTLEQEIIDMKKQKANLQRKLKEELESHRKAKREQDLKILQLKRQEQRKQFELQKLTSLHNKQNNILKRKTEEVVMMNKRIRSMVQQQVQKNQKQRLSVSKKLPSFSTVDENKKHVGRSNAEVIEEINKLIETTFEVQTTIYSAKNAIQLELNERKSLALEISRLEAQQSEQNTGKLANLKDALNEKNAEIRQLQQTLTSVERNNSIPPGLFPANTTLCHQIIRQLIETAVESNAACIDLENCKNELETAENRIVAQAHQYVETVATFNKELEKVGLSPIVPNDIMNLVDVPTGSGVIQHTTAMQDELEEMKKEVHRLREQLIAKPQTKKVPVKKKPRESLDVVELSSSSEEEEDSGDDSDYVEEEDRRGRANKRSRAASTARSPIGIMDEIDQLLDKTSRVGDKVCCSCNGKCATKGCVCKAEKQMCGSDCSCNAAKCHNREGYEAKKKRSRRSDPLADDKENEVESFFESGANKENEQPQERKFGTSIGVDKENEPPVKAKALGNRPVVGTEKENAQQTKMKKLWDGGNKEHRGKFGLPLRQPTTLKPSSINHNVNTSFRTTGVSRFF